MAATVPAKSILKTEATDPKPTLSDERKAQAERDRRNLGIALHHVNKIQARKETEAKILLDVEELIEFPSSSAPTSTDASRFATLVQPFQLSDFDSLVEERRIYSKCGYPLCSGTPRSVTLGQSSAWKLKGKGEADYCSRNCLKKALYVKAQLSEVPAWERESGQHPEVVLHEDDRQDVPTSQLIALGSSIKQVANDHDLALERGDTRQSFRPGQVMASNVVERTNSAGSSPRIINPTPSSHTTIEGYEPRKRVRHALDPSPRMDDDGDAYVGVATAEAVGDEENDAWRELFKNVDR